MKEKRAPIQKEEKNGKKSPNKKEGKHTKIIKEEGGMV